MSAQEMSVFEQRRLDETEFDEEVLRHLQARAAIRAVGRKRLKENFEHIYQEKKASATDRRRSRLTGVMIAWRVAAGIVLLLVAGGLLWQLLKPPSPQTLYAEHISFPSIPGVRGTVRSDSLAWEKALRMYERGDYQQSVELLEPFSSIDTFAYRSFASFYQGLAYLHLSQSQEAIARFERVERPGLYTEQVDWYIALAYLQAEDIEGARAALQKIVDQKGHYKTAEAEEMLGEL
ncbi:MAG: tetratricopeptide repeat protein [Bacteroidota bacterium]